MEAVLMAVDCIIRAISLVSEASLLLCPSRLPTDRKVVDRVLMEGASSLMWRTRGIWGPIPKTRMVEKVVGSVEKGEAMRGRD